MDDENEGIVLASGKALDSCQKTRLTFSGNAKKGRRVL
jgi:hypothetical protein